MADDSRLLSVLEFLRERGAIGELSLTSALSHANHFVAAVPEDCGRLLDLGSGGGLPGLVVASRLPQVEVVLTDRREHRMDLLRRACAQLGFGDRVSVCTGDVRDLARQSSFRGTFDVVTARAFGQPLWTLRCAHPFLRPGGLVIVSEPPSGRLELADGAGPTGRRWPSEPIERLGFAPLDRPSRHVRCFVRHPQVPRET